MKVVDARGDAEGNNFVSAPCIVRHRGLFVTPDLSSVGSVIAALDHDRKTHRLDVVPRDDTDTTTMSVRRLMAVLTGSGLVSSKPSGKAVTPTVALKAICDMCFPSTSNEVRGGWRSGA